VIDDDCPCCGGWGRYETSFDGHRSDYDPCLYGCPRRRNTWAPWTCQGCGTKFTRGSGNRFDPHFVEPESVDRSGPFCEPCMRKEPATEWQLKHPSTPKKT
jgi:hypothetical protein